MAEVSLLQRTGLGHEAVAFRHVSKLRNTIGLIAELPFRDLLSDIAVWVRDSRRRILESPTETVSVQGVLVLKAA